MTSFHSLSKYSVQSVLIISKVFLLSGLIFLFFISRLWFITLFPADMTYICTFRVFAWTCLLLILFLSMQSYLSWFYLSLQAVFSVSDHSFCCPLPSFHPISIFLKWSLKWSTVLEYENPKTKYWTILNGGPCPAESYLVCLYFDSDAHSMSAVFILVLHQIQVPQFPTVLWFPNLIN